MSSAQRSALARALAHALSHAADADVDAIVEFAACVLEDDPTPGALAPMLSLTLGDGALAARAAAALAQAWVDPVGIDAWLASSPAAVVGGGEEDDTTGDGVGGGGNELALAPAADAQPAAVHASAPPREASSPPARQPRFAPKLSQAERRRLERERASAPDAGAARPEPPLQYLLQVPSPDAAGGTSGGGASGRRQQPLVSADTVRICRHFLAAPDGGGCLRSDCAFSHDASRVPCRFWPTLGGCAAGADCPFFHHVDGSGGSGGGVDIRELAGGSSGSSRRYDGSGDGGGDGDDDGGEEEEEEEEQERRAPARTLAGAAGLLASSPAVLAQPLERGAGEGHEEEGRRAAVLRPSSMLVRLPDGAATCGGSGSSVDGSSSGECGAHAGRKGESTEADPTRPLDDLSAEELEWILQRIAALEEEGGEGGNGSEGDEDTANSREGEVAVALAGRLHSGGLPSAALPAAVAAQPALDVSDAALFPSLQQQHSGSGGGGGRAPLRRPAPHTLSGPGGGGGSTAATLLPTGGGAPASGPRTLASLLPAGLLQRAGADAPGGAAGASSSSLWGVGCAAATAAAGASTTTSGGDSVATRLALAVLQRAFPTLSGDLVRAAYSVAGPPRGSGGGTGGSGGGGDAVRAAAAVLAREYGVEPVPGVLVRTRAPPPPSSSSSSFSSAGGGGAAGRACELAARRIAASLERVPTGDSVSALYLRLRSDADALAKARNLAFHRSTRAYLAGDGADAARFARQGRALDEQMRSAHAVAAGEIFAARNCRVGGVGGGGGGGGGLPAVPPPGGSGGGKGGGGTPPLTLPPAALLDVAGSGVASPLPVHVFDLHGLHPPEAADVAGGVLHALATRGSECGVSRSPADGSVWLAFVTGSRHHSQKLGKGGGSIHDALVAALGAARGVELYCPPSAHAAAAGDAGGGAGSGGCVVVRLASV